MIYTPKIQKAISFATKVHQGQFRKGKETAYITHPLAVGLSLSQAGADEDTIVAGILHDTIEDSTPENKVSQVMLEESFGKEVAQLVASVTEFNKELSWEVRKQQAYEHIKTFSTNSLLVKSADIISNTSDLVEDYEIGGDEVFARFNASKEKILQHYLRVIAAIIEKWSANPFAEDLQRLARELQSIGRWQFMNQLPAQIIEYADYSENMPLQCSVCGWKGTPEESGWIEHYDDLLDVSCPNCEKMLLVVKYPLVR